MPSRSPSSAARHEDWSALPEDDRRRAHAGRLLPGLPVGRVGRHAAEGGRLSTCVVTASGTSRRTTRRACRSFRMRENVRLGEPDDVAAWHATLARARRASCSSSLGPRRRRRAANDPFFGRGGRMLAASQREQELKFELVVPDRSSEKPTAIMSCNYHQDHFGVDFGIRPPTGASRTRRASASGWSASRSRSSGRTGSTRRLARRRPRARSGLGRRRRVTALLGSIPAPYRPHAAALRRSARARRRTATWTSGSSCSTRCGSSRWRCSRSALSSTSRATSGRSSSRRRRPRAALRRSTSRSSALAAAAGARRASSSRSGALVIVEVDGSTCRTPRADRYRQQHVKTLDRGRGDRRRRGSGCGTSTTPATSSSRATTTAACSGSSELSADVLPPYVEFVRHRRPAPARRRRELRGRRRGCCERQLARPPARQPGSRASASGLTATCAGSAGDGRVTTLTRSRRCASAAPPGSWPRRSCAGSTGAAPWPERRRALRRARRRVEDAAVQAGPRRGAQRAARSGADAIAEWRRAGTQATRRLAA